MKLGKGIDKGAGLVKQVTGIGITITLAAATAIAEKKIGKMNSDFIDSNAKAIKKAFRIK